MQLNESLRNSKNKYSNQKGITLVALIVTIVVLLILAGVSINAIFSENGIINKAKDVQNKMDQATQNDLNAIDELNNWIDSKINGIVPSDYTWTQNKTTVTGTPKAGGSTITREVGADFTYDCGVSSYTGSWKILGADKGKLLIMSTVAIGTLSLSGGKGYNTGISQLNEMCALYGTEARSITVEDINRVTGYTPKHKTISITSENKYYYDDDQTNQQTTNGSSIYKYLDMASELGIVDNNQITSKEWYHYYPTTLTENDGEQIGEIGISKTSSAHEMLFGTAENISTDNGNSYWLASSCMGAGSNNSGFGLYGIGNGGRVGRRCLWYSDHGAYTCNSGVRAVVSL